MPEGGLDTFGLTIEDAIDLPRGKRRAVAGYLLRLGFYEQARDLLIHVAAEDPTGMLYRTWLVEAYLGCGQVDEADRLSTQLLTEFTDHRRVLTARAAVLFARNDLNGGLDTLKRWNPDPKSTLTYWERLATAAQRRGRWDESLYCLGKALEIDESRKQQPGEEPEDRYAPTSFWLALAAQESHDNSPDRPHTAELERARSEEEAKVREALARPDPADHRRRSGVSGTRSRNEQELGVPMPDASISERSGNPETNPTTQEIHAPGDTAQTELTCDPNPELEAQLKQHFGFAGFRPGQQQVVESVLAGRSVLAVMPTGAGKSLCYQLPAMLAEGVTLVVSPLIALMKDQVDGLPAGVQRQATLINSSLEGDLIEQRLREIRAGKYRLVYAAPERLRQIPFLHAMRARGVSLFVVDEAHCVSLWGHDFRPDYLFIGKALAYLGHPTVLAMTATATPRMRVEISNHFGRQMNLVSTGTRRPNLFLESVMVRTDEQKMRELIGLCSELEGAGIVYVRSRKKTEELARILRRERVQATHYHAGMESDERARTHEEFMDGRWRVICATVAFGMGIDKSDVRFVIHYSLPQSLEDYYQEAGRAGRDGRPSRCVLLATPSDKAKVTRWMRQERVDIDLPRRCYTMIRDLTTETPYTAVHPDDFERELEVEETQVRVAVSLLENIGLIRRLPDIPTTATIGVTAKGASEGDEQFAAFVESARLRPNQRVPLETMRLVERTGIRVDEIEEKLLSWRDAGYITYHGSGRVMLIERLPAPKDAKHLLEDLLARYARAQEARVDKTFLYAEARGCRHGIIAEHFGGEHIEHCSSCDNCAPQRQPQVSKQAAPAKSDLTDDERMRAIVETVRRMPGKVGFTGLVRLLKGSVASHIKRDRCPSFGILANEPKTTIERCVTRLLESDYLQRDDSEYRLIWLGPKAGDGG